MTIHIIGGGTISPVRNHFALAAPAYGGTARALEDLFKQRIDPQGHMGDGQFDIELHLTRMAGGPSLETNDDVAALIDRLVAEPATKVVILNAALVDFLGKVVEERHGEDTYTASGKYADRLKTRDGVQHLGLFPAEKIIGRIRKTRKDIFAVGFKTTTGATPDEQYIAALNLLKANSLNLVVANDTVTRHNMIVAPEETRYFEGGREQCLSGLADMVLARKDNTFTRSTVVAGDLVPWASPSVPVNLQRVVDHCVARGAYKPFRERTVGHFAVRLDDHSCLTSVRKTNFNESLDLVKVEYDGNSKVIAHGAKPSVGGQSQRIIFDEHRDLDCIVHFHCPLKDDAPDLDRIAIDNDQWSRECGSTECGKSVSDKLAQHGELRAVMIDNHGPNIVFSRNTPAERVIDFIERNFDLGIKTGGSVETDDTREFVRRAAQRVLSSEGAAWEEEL
jgi:hypothetical protein